LRNSLLFVRSNRRMTTTSRHNIIYNNNNIRNIIRLSYFTDSALFVLRDFGAIFVGRIQYNIYIYIIYVQHGLTAIWWQYYSEVGLLYYIVIVNHAWPTVKSSAKWIRFAGTSAWKTKNDNVVNMMVTAIYIL